ncbi:hypothetical protein GGF39_000141 [Coemansia sp. RSA 1721]|nr:hypothetical protein GGF39_000141 [Coemansia sp. RSA 1721]
MAPATAAISKYKHSAGVRFLAIHRRPHHHHATNPLEGHVPDLHNHVGRDHIPGSGKSGYLMVWDKQQEHISHPHLHQQQQHEHEHEHEHQSQQHHSHYAHHECGWVMEFCTITSSGEFVCLSKETSQPLVIFDVRSTIQRIIGSSTWGKQAIEVVDILTGKPVIFLRASTKAETAAWLLEMQSWTAPSCPQSLTAAVHAGRKWSNSNTSGTVEGVGEKVPADVDAVASPGINTAAAAGRSDNNHNNHNIGSSIHLQQSSGSRKRNADKDAAGNTPSSTATLLLPTHSRKPPQLVQALVHTMAPAAQKFRVLVQAYSHSLEEGRDHQDIFSYFSYPRSSIFTDIMQPCLPVDSDVRILVAGLLYLRMHSSGDLFNPISHVLARDGEWHPYIAVLAQCEQCVSLLLYEVGESVVVEVADIDVQVLFAHDIQAEDDSLFEGGGSFGFHINLSSDSECLPSGCNMASVIAGSSHPNSGRVSNGDESCLSAKSAPVLTMDKKKSPQCEHKQDTQQQQQLHHDSHNDCETINAHFEESRGHVTFEVDDTAEDDQAERKSRRRSRSLGHLIGIEGLSIGGNSSKRSKHNRFFKHGKEHKNQPSEKAENSSRASITSSGAQSASVASMPSVLYLAAMRAGERNNWIAQLRRYAQTAYSGAVQRPISNPVSAPLVFRVERCMWIKVHEVQGLVKSGDSATALVVIDGHVVAQSEVMTSNSKAKVEATSHFFGSLPPIQRGVHVLVRHKEKHSHSGSSSSNSGGGGGGLMGYCQIPIPMLQRGSTYNGWYPLSHGNVSEIDQQIGSYLPLATNIKPAWRRWTSKHPTTHTDSSAPSSSRPSTPFRSGDVHIQVRYDELVVLSSPFYVDIVTLLLDTRPTLIFDLISVLPRSADWLVETTTKIAICSNRVVAWIEAIVQHELASQAVPDPALIFRGASVATRAMDTLMKVIGLSFLDYMIGNVVRDVASGNYHCEVDPSRLGPKEDIDDHWRTLLHLQRILWLGVEESIDHCPPTLSRVFGSIRAAIVQFYSEHSSHEQVRYSCISGFLFLRLVCPAMLSPKTFGLVGTQPNASALRTLTLLAKGIQCTANLTDFALKEPYMQPMNAFVQQSVPKLKRFIDYIAENPMDSMDVDSDGTRHTAPQIVVDEERMAIMTVDRERELAAFSDFLHRSRGEIRQAIALSSPKPSTAALHRAQAGSPATASLPLTSSLSAESAGNATANFRESASGDVDISASANASPSGDTVAGSVFVSQIDTRGQVAQSTHSTAMDADSDDEVSMECSGSQNAQNADAPKPTSSAALAETARLIDGLVQVCELVQECVDACMQSPYTTAILNPSCAKEFTG